MIEYIYDLPRRVPRKWKKIEVKNEVAAYLQYEISSKCHISDSFTFPLLPQLFLFHTFTVKIRWFNFLRSLTFTTARIMMKVKLLTYDFMTMKLWRVGEIGDFFYDL